MSNPDIQLTLPQIEAMLRAGRVLFLPLGGDGPRWVERLADGAAGPRAGEEAQ